MRSGTSGWGPYTGIFLMAERNLKHCLIARLSVCGKNGRWRQNLPQLLPFSHKTFVEIFTLPKTGIVYSLALSVSIYLSHLYLSEFYLFFCNLLPFDFLHPPYFVIPLSACLSLTCLFCFYFLLSFPLVLAIIISILPRAKPKQFTSCNEHFRHSVS